MKFTRCGLDIAKQVFHVHGVNEHGVVKGRKTLARTKVLKADGSRSDRRRMSLMASMVRRHR